MRGLQQDVWGQGRGQLLLIMTFIAILPSLARAESLSWGAASVVQAPEGFSYSIAEIMFPEPRAFSTGAGVTRRLDVVRVVVTGIGFRPKATGPIVWLNGTPTLRTKVAEDGTEVEAYFLEPLNMLEAAASRAGRWELVYQSHEGAREVYRISPTGDPADIDRRPSVLRLSPQERAQIDALHQRFRIE
jgi:hypothetical protein